MATHYRSQNTRGKSGKPSKPGLVKRASGNTFPKSKNVYIRDDSEEHEDDTLVASFPQYCTMCEKQIVTPDNTILYCSESCRRKDMTRLPSYDLVSHQSPPTTPLQTCSSFERFQDIVPQRSPTAMRFQSNRYSYSSFSEDEPVYSDDERYPPSRKDSESDRYLQYLASQQSVVSQPRTPRTQYTRSSTAYSVPSLSHSPGSTDNSLPYTLASRPLPLRTNPTYSTSFHHSKSIDLVNPFAAMTLIHPTTAPSSFRSLGQAQNQHET